MANTRRDASLLIRAAEVHPNPLENLESDLRGSGTRISTALDQLCQVWAELAALPSPLQSAILRTAALTLRLYETSGGSTVCLHRGDMLGQRGFAVGTHPERSVTLSSPATQPELVRYILDNLDVLILPDHALGTWANRKSAQVLDVVVCMNNQEQAIEMAVRYGEWSIFDLEQGIEIITENHASAPHRR